MIKIVLAAILLTGGLLLSPVRCFAQSKAEINSASTRHRAVEAFGQFPLSFEANAGQADRQVRFLSRGPGYTLFLTSDEAVLVGGKNKLQVARMKLIGANPAPEVRGSDELSGRSFYFIGNDPKNWQGNVPNYAQVRYQAVYPGIDLSYYGNRRQLEFDFLVAPKADPKCIRLSFPGAQKIRIDPENGELKLDGVGGEVRFQKPVAYQMRDGKTLVEARYVLKRGNQVGIAVGNYNLAEPLIIDPVLIFSTLLGGGSGYDLGTSIAVDAAGNAYVTGTTQSPNFPIVHPLPAPNNALQGTENAFVCKLSFDSATSKLSLAYSAYLGGSGGDTGTGIGVDADGNAYVTGFTDSANFPIVHSLPAPNNAFQGASTAFVSKLSFDSATSTLSLAYSTYLGGSGGDNGAGIAVDALGNAYVTGQTGSVNFPIVHPLPTSKNPIPGGQYAFVSKLGFDSATSKLSLLYSTYLGGSTDAGSSPITGGDGIAIDSLGNAYVTGATGTTDFPVAHSLPPPDNVFRGSFDVFVSKLSFDSTTSKLSLTYSTLLGGTFRMGAHNSGTQEGTGIAVDSSGNAYVIGYTFSSDFTVVNPLPGNGALQGQENAFVSKLSFDSTTSTLSLAYSTYLGGSGGDSGFDQGAAIAVDSVGNAYVTGSTTSPDFPIVNPLPSPNKPTTGNVTAFVGKLNFDSTTSQLSLAYSTFLGGDVGIQEGGGIAVDTSGNAYVTGITTSSNYPLVHPLPPPSNALQGIQSVFVAKIGSGTVQVPPLANAGPDQTVSVGSLVTLDGSASSDPGGQIPLTYLWSFVSKPPASKATLLGTSEVDPTFTPDLPGDYVIQLVVTNAAGLSSAATVTVSTLNSPPVADAGPDQVITVIGTVVHLNGSQSYDPDGQPITYQWSILSKPVGSKAQLTGSSTSKPSFTADVHGDYTIQLIVRDSLGAMSKPATVQVSFHNVAPVANAGLNQSAIIGETVTLNGSGSTDANGDALTYKWSLVSAPRRSHAVISNSTSEVSSFVPELPGTYVVQLIVNDGFANSAPVTVEIEAVRPGLELTRQVRSLQKVIADLPPTAFKHRNLQNSLLSKLNAALHSIREHRYSHALQQLENDILAKTNGCATAGAPDKNDWIVNCPDQSKVYTPLLNIIAEIRDLDRNQEPDTL
jgi:PKD domain/Beta-propeller repeat